jgi:hypothetical protein
MKYINIQVFVDGRVVETPTDDDGWLDDNYTFYEKEQTHDIPCRGATIIPCEAEGKKKYLIARVMEDLNREIKKLEILKRGFVEKLKQ